MFRYNRSFLIFSILIILAFTLTGVTVSASASGEDQSVKGTPVLSEEQLSLVSRQAELQQQLNDDSLSKDDQKFIKNELKSVDKQLKKLAKAEAKAEKDAARARKKKFKQYQKQYGDGPYPEEIEHYLADKPVVLQPFFRSLYIEGERNAVLNFNRLGVAAMESGYYEIAEWALDNSLIRIESIYADNPAAKKAKSKFAEESVKEFKGEPYERSMAFYYRGLLYLREGDYENARASFKAAEFQDTMSEHEEFMADFAVLNYLTGWASQCSGDQSMASEFYAEAMKHNSSLLPPEPQDSVLLIGELGLPPSKVGEGKYNEILKFRKNNQYGEQWVEYTIVEPDGTVLNESAIPASSVYNQATTRGGRPIDGLLEGKAQFKDGMSATGEVLTTVGVSTMAAGYASGNTDMGNIGAAASLIGLFASMAAEAAKPESDTRYWDNLPDVLTVATVSANDLEAAEIVASFDGSGDVPEKRSMLLVSQNGSCAMAWTRSRSALSVPESAPNARMSWKEMKKQKKAIREKDMAFRDALDEESPGGAM